MGPLEQLSTGGGVLRTEDAEVRAGLFAGGGRPQGVGARERDEEGSDPARGRDGVFGGPKSLHEAKSHCERKGNPAIVSTSQSKDSAGRELLATEALSSDASSGGCSSGGSSLATSTIGLAQA